MLNLIQLAILHALFSPVKAKAWAKMNWLNQNRAVVMKRARVRASLRNPEEARKSRRESARRRRFVNVGYARERRAKDPIFRIEANLRGRTIHALRGRGEKSAKTLELLGCTGPQLRDFLTAKFRPGMAWKNYGSVWEIDHRQPCASFDLSDPVQQRLCFHFSNLQPLFVPDNRAKKDKYVA